MLGSLLKSVLGVGATPADLQAGVAAYQNGDMATAQRLVELALRTDPRNAAAWFYAGLVAAKSARHQDALRNFERAIEFEPGNAGYHYQLAETEYRLGNPDAAWRACERVLACNPEFDCHWLRSRIALPGPLYLEVLSFVHQALWPRTYLEIGVASGKSLALVLPCTRAIGIDPEPAFSEPAAGVSVFRMTSDHFFATCDVRAELGGLPIDLAFIDGQHHFECALRDFINIEKYSAAESTVLIHDCYPLDRRTAERERISGFWSGDIWRLVLALRKYRPDLAVHTIAAPPTGIAIVRGLDPASTVLNDGMESIVAEYLAMDYAALEADKPGLLNRLPNDLAKVETLLRDGAARHQA